MADMLLQQDGDLFVGPDGDIRLTSSVRQEVLIRLRWILGEWRLGPSLGFPWFEEVFIKNPNTLKIRGRVREEVMKVEGVKSCTIDVARYSPQLRQFYLRFTCMTDQGSFREEMTLYG